MARPSDGPVPYTQSEKFRTTASMSAVIKARAAELGKTVPAYLRWLVMRDTTGKDQA